MWRFSKCRRQRQSVHATRGQAGQVNHAKSLATCRAEGAETRQLQASMRRAFAEVNARASKGNVSLRVAAYALGVERVLEAARTRGYI
jgi:glutamate dehydrogenase/leucine dehydrogenase